mmetsp:Transcript_15165/g.25924  ORF Transcript_15165/g.25924 Transcript_15165/m.25924 type:complete len:664 (+) Transcript_15165:78-2069(+)
MPCPYAAALSDDEDASHHSPDHNDHPPTITGEALQVARQKCPAFANNAPCPFRDCPDPDSLREVMKTVPPSHFPSSSIALQKMIAGKAAEKSSGSSEEKERGGGESGDTAETSTAFQLAMEHVHQVSSLLEKQKQTNDSASKQQLTNETGRDLTKANDGMRDSFIIRGGCPFKSFHKEHPNKNGTNRSSKQNLARAMEDFSLAAIMGRMASELDGDEEDECEVDATQELHQDEEPGKANNDAPASSASNMNEQSTVSSPKKSTMQQTPPQGSLLSQALKTGTAESHTAAENVHFVNNFIQGIIPRDLYMDLLTGLYHTYITLEALLEEHAPAHFPTLHFPKELSRAEALREDMEFWHGHNWETKPECRTPSPAVRDYMDRMVEVGRIDPLLLLSHAYTRYLGDLSGGKVLSRIARRALHLDKKGYDGLQFYNFECIPSAKLFKDRYREALDELVLRPDQVGRLVAEANVAFALNMRVFEELDVKGGVEGARVRNVREALAYYDAEMEEQTKNGGQGRDRSSTDEEAKCPFGFMGGPNPHNGSMAKPKEDGNRSGEHDAFSKASSSLASGTTMRKGNATAAAAATTSQSGGGRCPWPFVFFHDSITGMKDWQTWFVIGLMLCWFWSSFVVGDVPVDLDGIIVEGGLTDERAQRVSISNLWGVPI